MIDESVAIETIKIITSSIIELQDKAKYFEKENKELYAECNGLQASLDLQHKADQRAIKMWHDMGNDPLVWPDKAALCIWLLEGIDELKKDKQSLTEELGVWMKRSSEADAKNLALTNEVSTWREAHSKLKQMYGDEFKEKYNLSQEVIKRIADYEDMKLMYFEQRKEREKWQNQAESLQKCSKFKKEYDPKLQEEINRLSKLRDVDNEKMQNQWNTIQELQEKNELLEAGNNSRKTIIANAIEHIDELEAEMKAHGEEHYCIDAIENEIDFKANHIIKQENKIKELDKEVQLWKANHEASTKALTNLYEEKREWQNEIMKLNILQATLVDPKKFSQQPKTFEWYESTILLLKKKIETADQVVMNHATDMSKLHEDNKKYKKALTTIKGMGRVCDEFEICTHVACADSCGSTLVAIEALREEQEVVDEGANEFPLIKPD